MLGAALSLTGAVASGAAAGPLRWYALVVAATTGVLAAIALLTAGQRRRDPVRGPDGRRGPRRPSSAARLRLLGLALGLMAVGWVVVAAQQRVGVAVVVAGGLLLLLTSTGDRPALGAGRR